MECFFCARKFQVKGVGEGCLYKSMKTTDPGRVLFGLPRHPPSQIFITQLQIFMKEPPGTQWGPPASQFQCCPHRGTLVVVPTLRPNLFSILLPGPSHSSSLPEQMHIYVLSPCPSVLAQVSETETPQLGLQKPSDHSLISLSSSTESSPSPSHIDGKHS